MEWGICTTVKAPLPQILAFVAWHKHLGAAQIWVHLDDADEINASVLGMIDGVTPVLCDDAYWAQNKHGRLKKIEGRQIYNMRRVYGTTTLPVVAHLDIDEYLLASREIADILADWDDGFPILRAEPAEALHDPSMPDDIFTARQFRLPFPKDMPEARRAAILGDYEILLPRNVLSHRAGKSFFKTGVENLRPRIHAATMAPDDARIHTSVHPELKVLHFHAQDKADWLAAMPNRATHGAYRFNKPLAAFLQEADPAEIDHFYTYTQEATPRLVEALRAEGLLVEAQLDLKAKVAEFI